MPSGAPLDWRLGGPTVSRWNGGLLGRSLMVLGVGIVLGALVQLVWRSPWAPASAAVIVLIAMLVPVISALRISRPAGLLRFRALDLLFGVALGAMLRLLQGYLEIASGASGALPSYSPGEAPIPSLWALTDVVLPGVVAPVVEEFFFRAVLLVATYSLLRRTVGTVAAGAAAVLCSAGVFVLVDVIGQPLRIDSIVAAAALGLVCGLLVVLTGRVWGAVLVHLVFSASFVALALVGTVLG